MDKVKSHHSEKSRHSIDSHKSAERDNWEGHYNRLSASQQDALSQFKAALQEHELYTPDPQSHDDPTLIRYLRARKFDVKGALAQFKETDTMRKHNRIDSLYNEIDVEFYERARRLYPQWTGHRDKRGLPLYVYQIKHLDHKTINHYTKDVTAWKNNSNWATAPASAKLLPLYALYENMLTFVLPLCSTLERKTMDVPITQGTNIVDVSGVGIKTFWNLKSHMQEASQMATAHFPETLDRIFIIGAPYFFPTVWGWIKRWFDPNTVSKIFVLSHHDMKRTLEEYFEPESIPKAYGGQLDWEYGQHPAMDSAVKERVGNQWIQGPCRWEGQVVPVGTVDGKERPRPPPLPKAAIPPTTLTASDAIAPPLISPEKDSNSQRAHVYANIVHDVEAVTTGIATTTINGDGSATIVVTQPAVETETPISVVVPESQVSGVESETKLSTVETISEDPVQKLPTNNIDALSAALDQAEHSKVELQPNGIVKPPLERFETAAEDLSKAS